MQLADILKQTGGIGSVAKELGISESQAASGAQALLPALLGGLKKQAAAQPSGLEALPSLLGRLGGGGLLDEVLSPQPTNVNRGNEVLGQLFGSKDVSRAVAQQAAGQTGLDPALLKKMLPMVAMLVTGYLGKQGASGAAAAPAGGLGSLLGNLAGGPPGAKGGGLASLLDLDGDGNPLDDILGMATRLKR